MSPATDARADLAGVVASRSVPVALLLGGIAGIPFIVDGYASTDTTTQIVTGSIAVLLLAVAALILVNALPDSAPGLARWRLGPWYLLWAGLSYGVASLTWLGPQTGSAATRISLSNIPVALSLVAAALVAWTAGYLAGPPQAIRTMASGGLAFVLRGTSSQVPGPGIPWFLYGIGTVARLASLLLRGGFGYVGDPSSAVSEAKPYAQTLSMFSMLAVYGIAVAAYRAFATKGPSGWATLATLLGIEMIVGALGGGKESFVVCVLAVVIPYGAIRGRLPARVLAIGALLFLLVVLPFNQAYRSTVRNGHEHLTPAQAVAAAPEIFSEIVAVDSPDQVLSDSADTLLHRVRMIDNVAIITQMTPGAIPYRSPTDFALAPMVSLVPRAIWPDKPVLATGYEFSQEYYGLPSTVFTSSAITALGDLYRHGGWYVLIIGALVFGVGCRLFDLLFRSERDLRAIFFALAFLPVIVKSEVDMYTMVIGIPSGIVTAMLGAHLACRAGLRTRALTVESETDPAVDDRNR